MVERGAPNVRLLLLTCNTSTSAMGDVFGQDRVTSIA